MTVSINGTSGLVFNDASTQNTAATGFGFKNRIINGAMMIDQRNAGASQSISGAAYTVDRWKATPVGATITGQRVAGTVGGQYNYRFTGASGVTNIYFEQRIESSNSYDLAGTTVTLSFYTSNSTLTSVVWYADYANSTDSFSSTTNFAQGSVTVNSTMTKYSVTFSVPSVATTGIVITLGVGAQTSGTWNLGQIQLEKGSTATSFDYRPYGTELALCQRYYNKVLGTGSGLPLFMRWIAPGAGNGIPLNYTFKSSMRSAPTWTKIGTWSSSNCNQPIFSASTTEYVTILAEAAGSGDSYVYANNVSMGFDISSEL